MTTLQNGDLQDALRKYPADSIVALVIRYGNAVGVFTDLMVGDMETDGLHFVVMNSESLDEDYTGLLDGKECVFDEEEV